MSSKRTYYRQCVLERTQDETTTTTTTWIDESGAKLGNTMRIKEHGNDEWKPGRWTVTHVGKHRQLERVVKANAHRWTKYRSATDV